MGAGEGVLLQSELPADVEWAPCRCRVCLGEPGAVIEAWTSVPGETRWTADVHRAFEVGVLLEGAEEKQCGGAAFTAQVGDTWLIPGYEVHAWRLAATTREFTVHFLPELLGEESFEGIPWLRLFACAPERRPGLAAERTGSEAFAIAQSALAEVAARPPAFVEGLRVSLLRLLLLLYRNWDHRQQAREAADRRDGRVAQVLPAINLVYADHSRRVSLAEAAAACGLSESYFDQRFRAVMGLPFARFETRKRLVNATRLLAAGDAPVETIAHETGFTDASHLHRRFAEVYGCTPGAYRERARSATR